MSKETESESESEVLRRLEQAVLALAEEIRQLRESLCRYGGETAEEKTQRRVKALKEILTAWLAEAEGRSQETDGTPEAERVHGPHNSEE
jgi:uncharacterized protein YlxW (UPF0749 family)